MPFRSSWISSFTSGLPSTRMVTHQEWTMIRSRFHPNSSLGSHPSSCRRRTWPCLRGQAAPAIDGDTVAVPAIDNHVKIYCIWQSCNFLSIFKHVKTHYKFDYPAPKKSGFGKLIDKIKLIPRPEWHSRAGGGMQNSLINFPALTRIQWSYNKLYA